LSGLKKALARGLLTKKSRGVQIQSAIRKKQLAAGFERTGRCELETKKIGLYWDLYATKTTCKMVIKITRVTAIMDQAVIDLLKREGPEWYTS
jgi:hypothetical protein